MAAAHRYGGDRRPADLRRAGSGALRVLLRRRGLLAGALAAAAVVTALPQVAPAAGATTLVVAASRDLPAGAALEPADVVLLELPAAAVPDGALTGTGGAVGRSVASAVRRGEPLTDARLLGPGLLAGQDGRVAAPVRLADPASGVLLGAGDRVDVLGATLDGLQTEVVAAGADVLAVPEVPDDGSGALVLLAVPPAAAARLAAAAVTSRLSVVVLP